LWRQSQVGTRDEWGEVQQLRIEHDGDSREMEKFLDGLEAGSRTAIEATGKWWWVVDLAEKHGHEVVLSSPKQSRLIADARLRNDRVDTDQLLRLLRLGYLPRVQTPPAMGKRSSVIVMALQEECRRPFLTKIDLTEHVLIVEFHIFSPRQCRFLYNPQSLRLVFPRHPAFAEANPKNLCGLSPGRPLLVSLLL
jgi:hypothetical protein